MKRFTLLLLIFTCFACGNKPRVATVHIALVNNQQSLKITGINYLILKEIAADTANNWQTLFAVYRMPADTDMKDYQPVQLGNYLLKDSSVVYTPDTAFSSNQTYFLRYYQYAKNDDAWELVKGQKRPGKTLFTDFVFKVVK